MPCCCCLKKCRIKSRASPQWSYFAGSISGLWIIPALHWNTHWFFFFFFKFHKIAFFQAFCARHVVTTFRWELWQHPRVAPAHFAFSRCAQGTGERRGWEEFLCNSKPTQRGKSSPRTPGELQLCVPVADWEGILLQDPSPTIELFYINDKIKPMQLRLIWHIFLFFTASVISIIAVLLHFTLFFIFSSQITLPICNSFIPHS